MSTRGLAYVPIHHDGAIAWVATCPPDLASMVWKIGDRIERYAFADEALDEFATGAGTVEDVDCRKGCRCALSRLLEVPEFSSAPM
jgi:hypothetical protein